MNSHSVKYFVVPAQFQIFFVIFFVGPGQIHNYKITFDEIFSFPWHFEDTYFDEI